MACVEAAIPVPDSRQKVDELFLFWLSEPSTQEMLRKELSKVCGVPVSETDDVTQASVTQSLLTSVLRPASPNVRTPSPPPSSVNNKVSPKSPRARHRSPRKSHKSPSGVSLREKLNNKANKYAEIVEETDFGEEQTFLHPLQYKSTAPAIDREERSHSPIPPAHPKSTPKKQNVSALIPKFYFPHGRPSAEEDVEKMFTDVAKVFQAFPNGEATMKEFHLVVKAMNLPLYWKAPLFKACVGKAKDHKSATYQLLKKSWQRITHNCHDESSRFIRMMAANGQNSLVEEDFEPLIQDIVDTHPGLVFLGSAPEFHQRYVETVIRRIFYVVDRNWNGRITAQELRRSNFLQTLTLLEEEPDINQINDYFSYEHFYVIYCKFWELDTDHDLLIDAQDLARHADHALTQRIINRALSGVVTKNDAEDGKMSYKDFIWFLLSEEDKTSTKSIEYWFRCMDIDGDGVLSLFELVYFYEEVLQKLQELSIDCLSIENTICQILDMVNPREMGKITLRDLKACKMTPIFFNTFVNIEKYLEYEQRDPVSMAGREDGDTEEMSEWDRYAAEQYELLLQEEQYEQDGFDEEDSGSELGEDEKEMLDLLVR